MDLFITAREVVGCIGHPPEVKRVPTEAYVSYELAVPTLKPLLDLAQRR